MVALSTVLQTKARELDDDEWMCYVGMQCPDPEMHELTGFCHDCTNKWFELEDKDVPVLAALMRLARCNSELYHSIR